MLPNWNSIAAVVLHGKYICEPEMVEPGILAATAWHTDSGTMLFSAPVSMSVARLPPGSVMGTPSIRRPERSMFQRCGLALTKGYCVRGRPA